MKSEALVERSRRGKRHAARNGSVNVLSGAPYGYRYIGKFAGGGRARYELHAEHAAVVRTIFTWIGVDGHSIREACRRLQAQQIPRPTGKSYWDPATVWGILRNPAYVGRAEFGKTREVAPRPRLRTQRGRPSHGRRAGSLQSGRAEISTYAPHLHMLNIPTDKIRDLIGPGGKKIRAIIEATGVKIDVMDDGKVHVFASSGAAAESALKMIRDVTATAEIGKTYLGTVVRIADFGAFVEIFPGTDGLLHISEIAEQRIRAVRDELKEGDQVLVKVLAIEGNKIRLSRKAVLRDQRDKQAKGEAAG